MDIKTILAIAIPFALFILGGLAAWALRNKRELASVAGWLEPVLLYLVTEAEREIGGGAGQMKLAAVVSWTLNKLPEKLKSIVTVEWLIEQIEKALKNAKDIWAKSPALICGAARTNAVGFALAEEETLAEDDAPSGE